MMRLWTATCNPNSISKWLLEGFSAIITDTGGERVFFWFFKHLHNADKNQIDDLYARSDPQQQHGKGKPIIVISSKIKNSHNAEQLFWAIPFEALIKQSNRACVHRLAVQCRYGNVCVMSGTKSCQLLHCLEVYCVAFFFKADIGFFFLMHCVYQWRWRRRRLKPARQLCSLIKGCGWVKHSGNEPVRLWVSQVAMRLVSQGKFLQVQEENFQNSHDTCISRNAHSVTQPVIRLLLSLRVTGKRTPHPWPNSPVARSCSWFGLLPGAQVFFLPASKQPTQVRLQRSSVWWNFQVFHFCWISGWAFFVTSQTP